MVNTKEELKELIKIHEKDEKAIAPPSSFEVEALLLLQKIEENTKK